jgi:carbamoyltransferase
MLVLGIHGGHRQETEDMEPDAWSMHDGAAVLLKDGEVIAAIEEERLNRVKHSNFFPNRAIRSCLAYAEVKPDQLDHIVINCTEGSMNYTAMMTSLREYSKSFRTGHSQVAELVSNALGQNVELQVRFCDHHLAHAWSAFIPSGFDRGLVLSSDG